nr:MAG TPA: hypothetical protein [Caudoviricetes sp.]
MRALFLRFWVHYRHPCRGMNSFDFRSVGVLQCDGQSNKAHDDEHDVGCVSVGHD